jgi:predicted lipoprotein with Yx(FWY)xxD motif
VQLLTSRTIGVRVLGAAISVAALGLATACGSSGAPAPAAAPSAAPVTFQDAAGQTATGHSGHAGHGGGAGTGPTELELYAVQTGTLGTIVTDGEGRVLYGSDGDQTNPPQSHCADACAQTWLPLTVPAGQEPQLLGVHDDVVGRLARQDGTSQLTLGGWPVYVNRSDDGQLKAPASGAQSAGWFAVSPSGAKVALPG